MNLHEIKAAVQAGKKVHWATPGYMVIQDQIGKFLITCPSTGGCWGLTRATGVTLNGRPEDFYLEPELKPCPACHSEALLHWKHEDRQWFYAYHCSNIWCWLSQLIFIQPRLSQVAAAELWNGRVVNPLDPS